MTSATPAACVTQGKLQNAIALLLDVDGTLLEFAPHPDAVHVPAPLPPLLARLHALLEGALALVSGRQVAALDRLFAPLQLPSIGLHGLECRPLAGTAVLLPQLEPLPAHVTDRLQRVVARHPNSFLEAKGSTVAVHHRQMPDAATGLYHQLQDICRELGPSWCLLRGHQVIEIKPRHMTKGSGVEALLQTPAFHPRLPVSFGDDTTDLDMFAAVRLYGGLNVSVGPRLAGTGQFHLAAPHQTIALLGRLAGLLAAPNPPPDQMTLLQQLLRQG